METERNYVNHLDMMQRKFIQPLRNMLEDNDVRILFANTEVSIVFKLLYKHVFERIVIASSCYTVVAVERTLREKLEKIAMVTN